MITLIAVGGGLYTLGGLVYGLRWPNPFPTWFGFHEVFHTFTIAAFVCHYVAASHRDVPAALGRSARLQQPQSGPRPR